MPKPRILIVDDHHEVRRFLQAALETLGPKVEVVAVPSGEEALLEAYRQPVHLLVADARLPGMTGLELMEKIRKRSPDMHVILITGMADQKVRRMLAEAKADAFFFKPIEIDPFLTAVTKALALNHTSPEAAVAAVESIPTTPVGAPPPAGAERERKPAAEIKLPPLKSKSQRNLSQVVANLRRDIHGMAIAVLDDRANPIEESGDYPPGPWQRILKALMEISTMSADVSASLGTSNPWSVICIRAPLCNIALARLGACHSLLILSAEEPLEDFPASIMAQLQAAIPEIMAALPAPSPLTTTQPGEPVRATAKTAPPPAQATPLVQKAPPKQAPPTRPLSQDELAPEELLRLDWLFQGNQAAKTDVQALDSYWEAATQNADKKIEGDDSILTYEEAQRLGLVSDSEEHETPPG